MTNGRLLRRWIAVSESGLFGGRIQQGVRFTKPDGTLIQASGDNAPGSRGFLVDIGDFEDATVSTVPLFFEVGPRYMPTNFNTGQGTAFEINVYMDAAPWPRQLRWEAFEEHWGPTVLPDQDKIKGTVEKNVLAPPFPGAEGVVEFVLKSDLDWRKVINVPDGETPSSWDIWTGFVPVVGGWKRQKQDSVALWAHQILNKQFLTFSKAKALGVMSRTYTLTMEDIVSKTGAQAGSRITFEWVQDA